MLATLMMICVEEPPRIESLRAVPVVLAQLLHGMLSKQPSARPMLTSLVSQLEHMRESSGEEIIAVTALSRDVGTSGQRHLRGAPPPSERVSSWREHARAHLMRARHPGLRRPHLGAAVIRRRRARGTLAGWKARPTGLLGLDQRVAPVCGDAERADGAAAIRLMLDKGAVREPEEGGAGRFRSSR